jgi:hypothetical protein
MRESRDVISRRSEASHVRGAITSDLEVLEIIDARSHQCHLAKVDVEGSNPFSRSRFRRVTGGRGAE